MNAQRSVLPTECRQERDRMLSCGIDTHQKMHQVEIQNHDGKVMWKGQISNNKKGFDQLLAKIKTIERSNSDQIRGIFMNPTGNYHVPIHHFLESACYKVIYIDPGVTDYARKMANLGKEKSDTVDAAMLASTPWKDRNAFNKNIHRREPVSEITRLRESVSKNITGITNIIGSDLACIFPEFTDMFPDMGSAISLAILNRFTTPGMIVKAGVETILKVMQKSSRNHYRREYADRLVTLASDSIGIQDTDLVYTFRIRQNVSRLISEKKHLKEIEEKILHDLKLCHETTPHLPGVCHP